MSPIVERTYPNGTVTYGIRWTDENGVDRKQSSKKWTKTQAKAALADIEERLDSGVATRVDLTVAGLFEEWHKHHAMLACTPVWQQDSRTQFKLRIEPMIGHRVIDTVKRSHVTAMMAQMQEVMRAKDPGNPYAGHATINKTLTVMKSMFKYAMSESLLARSPVHGVPELEEQPEEQRTAWPLEAIEQIALAARHLPDRLPEFQRGQQAKWVGERDYTIIMLAALTGLRQSEILGLRWDDISDGWIHLTHKLCRRTCARRLPKSKRGKRRVPLLGDATRILAEWRAGGAPPEIVFPNQSGDGHQRAEHFYNKAWLKAREVAGTVTVGTVAWDCARMKFHELRHTFFSLALAAGRHLWEVAKWGGDHPDTVERYYGHYIPDSLGDTRELDRAMSVTRTQTMPSKPRLTIVN
jgi:integrase